MRSRGAYCRGYGESWSNRLGREVVVAVRVWIPAISEPKWLSLLQGVRRGDGEDVLLNVPGALSGLPLGSWRPSCHGLRSQSFAHTADRVKLIKYTTITKPNEKKISLHRAEHSNPTAIIDFLAAPKEAAKLHKERGSNHALRPYL